jgi:hypothetical protein
MGQIFHPSTNTIAKASIVGGACFLAGLAGVWGVILDSPYVTEAYVARRQPVPFSHKHHVGDVGLDCRYCHSSVEQSAYAGLPSTKVCMTCHSQLFTDAAMLEPVRSSFRDDASLEWIRVNDLPDYVYFNHSIHVKNGVGCVTCHGPVDQMPLTWRANTLNMNWCLGCHRDPAAYIRPREHVFDPQWKPDEDQRVLGERLMKEYGIDKRLPLLTNCWTCHR